MPFSENLKTALRHRAWHCCCRCHDRKPLEVHHIVPQAEGGPDTEDNAVPLCAQCHADWGGNPEKRKYLRDSRDSWFMRCDKATPETLLSSESLDYETAKNALGVVEFLLHSGANGELLAMKKHRQYLEICADIERAPEELRSTRILRRVRNIAEERQGQLQMWRDYQKEMTDTAAEKPLAGQLAGLAVTLAAATEVELTEALSELHEDIACLHGQGHDYARLIGHVKAVLLAPPLPEN